MDMRSSIEDTRKGFEASFATGDFYNRQTQDSQHLEKILQFLQVSDGMRILDLGCGSGYLAFPMAKNNPDIPARPIDGKGAQKESWKNCSLRQRKWKSQL